MRLLEYGKNDDPDYFDRNWDLDYLPLPLNNFDNTDLLNINSGF